MGIKENALAFLAGAAVVGGVSVVSGAQIGDADIVSMCINKPNDGECFGYLNVPKESGGVSNTEIAYDCAAFDSAVEAVAKSAKLVNAGGWDGAPFEKYVPPAKP